MDNIIRGTVTVADVLALYGVGLLTGITITLGIVMIWRDIRWHHEANRIAYRERIDS